MRKPNNQNRIPTAVASSSCPAPQPSPPSPTASPPPPWTELPLDITACILKRLGGVEILKTAQRVCTTWRRVSQDPAMWRVIDLKNFGFVEVENAPNVYRLAVERSQGQLIDLRLDCCADDELLTYIVQRSSKLRRLTVKYCLDITGEGLVEAVKKLPNLEELRLIIMPSVQPANVEAIGISCPRLKSFTLYECGAIKPVRNKLIVAGRNNVFALAIAKTMPNLRHLHLYANIMDNEGLQAILDGCPHLESLDIRQCFALDLRRDLGKRLSGQIKNLKRPSDSIDIAWFVGDDSRYSSIYG